MKFNVAKQKVKLAKTKARQKYKIDKLNAKAAAKIGLQKELGKTARIAAIMDHTRINIGNEPNDDTKTKGIDYYNQMIGNVTDSQSSSSNTENIGDTNADNRGK